MKIRNRFQFARAFLSAYFKNLAADIRLRLAERKKNKRRMHWRYGSTFGATVDLGYMTRAQALRAVDLITNDPVIYVDDEVGFIAVRSSNEGQQRD